VSSVGDERGSAGARALWLVRHGESTWNARGLVQGQAPGPRLTARGAEQAGEVARLLAGRPVVGLWTSDLRRATETAQAVARAVDVVPVQDVRLRERCFGKVEGAPLAELQPRHSGIAGHRVVDADAAPPGGESVRQLCRRVAGFLDELAAWEPPPAEGPPEPGAGGTGSGAGRGDVVLVVHGGVVRAALAHLDRVAPDAMSWIPVGNGAVWQRALPRRPTACRQLAAGVAT
jgi:2,3-bisphosphoglycerate-dependent phosphoglycerate mutase